jgi:hypothetical protein
MAALIGRILAAVRHWVGPPPAGEAAGGLAASGGPGYFGTYFSDIDQRRTGRNLKVFLLAYIIVGAYPFHTVPVQSGLDASWVFALNYLVNSNLFFGRDAISTCGPLGFLIWPQLIGNNASIALICHLGAWLLFAAALIFGAVKRLFSLDQLILFAIVMIICGAFSFDYFVSFLVLFLFYFSLLRRNWFPFFFLAVLLTPALFLMKLTSGLLVLPAIVLLSSTQILTNKKRGLLQLGRSLVLPPLLFVCAYLLYHNSFADMLMYLRGTFEITSGYSVSMSLTGAWYEIYFAMIYFVAYVYVVLHLYRSGQPSFWHSIAFIPSLFLAFKHGFVRQDAHVLTFFTIATSIFGLLLLFSDLKKAKMKEMTYIFPVLIFIYFFVFQQHLHTVPLDRILPISAIKRIHSTLSPGSIGKHPSLEKEVLPQDIRTEIGGNKVGIFPSEISYVAANNLDYSPLPVLESYCAHNTYLDSICADFLDGRKAPPYLLMGFYGVDGRHCLIDVPFTWLSIYKWYAPCLSAGPVLLLKKNEAPRFETLEPAGAAELRKTERVALAEYGGPLLVKITLDLTPTGNLVKVLYKILPVEMALTDDTGQVRIFRVVPDTLKDGVLLNYLPLDLNETGLLLNGVAVRRICSFELLGEGLKMYRDKMSVEFIKIPGIQISRSFKDLSFPEGVERSTGKTQFGIDTINQKPPRKSLSKIVITDQRFIRMTGWAVDDEAQDAGEGVWADIDGKSYPADRRPSPDVADKLHNPAYENAGFSVDIPVSSLSKGTHCLSVKLLAKNRQYYYQFRPIVLETPGG